MVMAQEFDELGAGLRTWQVYDPAVKVELFSTALEIRAGTFIVDPVSLAADLAEDFHNVTGVVVTNANHHRASAEFAQRFNVPIYARAESFGDARPPSFHDLDQNPHPHGELQSVAIEGAAPGEIALCVNRSLIVGDALINAEPYGFTFLPAKYCIDFKRMRQSLRQLVELDFDRILFAHGMPIISRAHARLTQLFEQ